MISTHLIFGGIVLAMSATIASFVYQTKPQNKLEMNCEITTKRKMDTKHETQNLKRVRMTADSILIENPFAFKLDIIKTSEGLVIHPQLDEQRIIKKLLTDAAITVASKNAKKWGLETVQIFVNIVIEEIARLSTTPNSVPTFSAMLPYLNNPRGFICKLFIQVHALVIQEFDSSLNDCGATANPGVIPLSDRILIKILQVLMRVPLAAPLWYNGLISTKGCKIKHHRAPLLFTLVDKPNVIHAVLDFGLSDLRLNVVHDNEILANLLLTEIQEKYDELIDDSDCHSDFDSINIARQLTCGPHFVLLDRILSEGNKIRKKRQELFRMVILEMADLYQIPLYCEILRLFLRHVRLDRTGFDILHLRVDASRKQTIVPALNSIIALYEDHLFTQDLKRIRDAFSIRLNQVDTYQYAFPMHSTAVMMECNLIVDLGSIVVNYCVV